MRSKEEWLRLARAEDGDQTIGCRDSIEDVVGQAKGRLAVGEPSKRAMEIALSLAPVDVDAVTDAVRVQRWAAAIDAYAAEMVAEERRRWEIAEARFQALLKERDALRAQVKRWEDKEVSRACTCVDHCDEELAEERLEACARACRGIEDPETTVPAMVKALRDLVNVSEEWNGCVDVPPLRRPANWTDGYLDKARAVLAKVKGGE